QISSEILPQRPSGAHKMLPRRWKTAALLAFLVADPGRAGKPSGSGSEPRDLLSGVSGTYTHFVDDDLSVTVSYDLQDDSSVPFSFVTGVSVTKAQDLYRKADPSKPLARLAVTGSALIKQRLPSGGATIDTGDRSAGININHAARRAQFRFARVFMDGRLRLGLNPVVTYGPLRKRRVNFSTLVPLYRPLLSESGLPSMSLQQRNLVWDWAQGLPSRSPLHGLGISLRLHTGRGGLLSATLYDGTDRSRLWSMRADVPLGKPSNVCFAVERAWQVPTTDTRLR
ncbi:unnamed protein product, partial [Scytosiphon promiscuus]